MAARIEKRSILADIVPLLVLCIVFSVIILIPFKVMGYGFLPLDDVLRHVAKAVSGREWNDILILRQGIILDSHPGYHAVLSFVHYITKLSPDAMVSFSVIVLFIIFCFIPILLMDRPEAWLAALLIISLTNFSFIMRLFLGRPYILTMAVISAICLLWPRLREGKRLYGTSVLITALIALSAWFHCSWYLLAFPALCFLLAKEWRVAFIISACTVSGILLGAFLTGHPILFLEQNVMHAFLAFNKHALPRTLAIEFRPFTGDMLSIFIVLLMLLWRQARGSWELKKIYNPVFILACVGWMLGFFVQRFWLDIGMPALLVWMAQELEDVFKKTLPGSSWSRLVLVIAIAPVLFLNITNDIDDRWTNNPAAEYLRMHAIDKTWMPGAGGIVYSDDMRAFFVTFFKYPRAPWRYLVGFEPGLMPQDDLDVFMNIQMTRGSPASFYPWVKKMKPADRLVITPEPGREPDIPELEWRYGGSGFWFGRLPENKQF